MGCRRGRTCAPPALATPSSASAAEQQADQFAQRSMQDAIAPAPGPLAHLLTFPSNLPSAGSPLPSDIRSRLEKQVGVDLSPVRLHDQPSSVRAARNGRAFSTGTDIVLGTPVRHPQAGRTLAHELAHVVQHGGGGRGLSDLSGSSNQLVQGDGGLTDRDRQAIRDWIDASSGTPGGGSPDTGGAGGWPRSPGPMYTFPSPGQTTRQTDFSHSTICNVNCHQTPEEQRQEAARRAEEAHTAALRRAWPGLVRTQGASELDKQGQTIQQDIDASRLAAGQLRLRMFDAAIAAGRHGGAAGATQLDERIRDAWTAAEQAANMIEAVYMASGNDPVPGVVTDPLRPWFVGFYASVSRLFRQLDTEDKMLAAAIRSAPLATGPSAMSPTCPGGCHRDSVLARRTAQHVRQPSPAAGHAAFRTTGPAAGATGPDAGPARDTPAAGRGLGSAGHLETDVDDGHRPLPLGHR